MTPSVHHAQPQKSNHQPFHRRLTLVTFLLLLITALVLTIVMVLPYLLAVVMGGILALSTLPIYRRLTPRYVRPSFAAFIVTVGIVLVILAPLSLFIAKAIEQGIVVAQNLSDNAFSLHTLIGRIAAWEPIHTLVGNQDTYLQDVGKSAMSIILGWITDVPDIILQMALACIACFFLLIDRQSFLKWILRCIPFDVDVGAKLARSFKDTAISTIWATLAAASAQSALMLFSFLALFIPAAFLAAGATFILAWIPLVGSSPVWIAGVIYLYSQQLFVKMGILIGCGLIIGIVDNFIRPLVLKGRSKMHPLVSLVAIFGGLKMFGILGVIVGPIIAAIVISLLSELNYTMDKNKTQKE